MPRRPAPAVTLALPLVVAAFCAPAAARAQAPAQATTSRIPVAARTLPRGAVLAATDIAWRDTTARARGDARVAAGWVTRRVIAAGEPLGAPAVTPPPMVRAHEPLDLVVRKSAFQLTVRGRVTRDAAAGDTVTVLLDRSRRVQGVVEAPGRVRAL